MTTGNPVGGAVCLCGKQGRGRGTPYLRVQGRAECGDEKQQEVKILQLVNFPTKHMVSDQRNEGHVD